MNKLIETLPELKGKFVFGSVQETSMHAFSPWLLPAFHYLEKEFGSVAFVLVGGSEQYKAHCDTLGCKNVYFIPLPDDETEIEQLLEGLDVFMHGSMQASSHHFLEMAQDQGLPVVSHFSNNDNSHVSLIGDSGVVHGDYNSYIFELWNLMTHDVYRNWRKEKALSVALERNGEKITADDNWLVGWIDGDDG